MEFRCTPEEKQQMRTLAERAGFPGRAFATWARNMLLGKPIELQRPATTLLSVAQAAEYCGVSRQTMHGWIETGEIVAYEMPEGLRVPKSELKTRRR